MPRSACCPDTHSASCGTRPGADGLSHFAVKHEFIREELISHHCKMQQATAQLARDVYLYPINHIIKAATLIFCECHYELFCKNSKEKWQRFEYLFCRIHLFFCSGTFLNGQYLHFQNNQTTFLLLFWQYPCSCSAHWERKSPLLLPGISTPLTCIKGASLLLNRNEKNQTSLVGHHTSIS